MFSPIPPSQSSSYTFTRPSKRIHVSSDLSTFHSSQAYADIISFILFLNNSLVPRKPSPSSTSKRSTTYPIGSRDVVFSSSILKLQALLQNLSDLFDEVDLDPAPRRFGNVAFRTWCARVEERARSLLEEFVDGDVLSFVSKEREEASALDELEVYLLGGLGSAQRLDYGTGHELSFLAFLGGLWRLGAFGQTPGDDEARQIVLGVLHPYHTLIRKVILKYSLEPAGSHGVWGLDDHFFLSYIFGSAQFCPAIHSGSPTPLEGSHTGSPSPTEVTQPASVQRYRDSNLYFSAIGFINDVKKGPFWEHSRTLYDISGVQAGWGKINKGMVKMFVAEVLGKFPVVQHFPFGSLWRWDKSEGVGESEMAKMSVEETEQEKTSMPPEMMAPWAVKKDPTARQTASSDASGIAPMRAPWAK